MNSITIAQWLIRVVGLIEFMLGVWIWFGHDPSIVRIHILLGLSITIASFYLIYNAYTLGVKFRLVDFACVMAIGLPLWAITHTYVFVNSLAWIGHALHLLCAIGTIGLSEILVKNINKFN